MEGHGRHEELRADIFFLAADFAQTLRQRQCLEVVQVLVGFAFHLFQFLEDVVGFLLRVGHVLGLRA